MVDIIQLETPKINYLFGFFCLYQKILFYSLKLAKNNLKGYFKAKYLRKFIYSINDAYSINALISLM